MVQFIVNHVSSNDCPSDNTAVVVVGGGAAGIELSLAMRARLGNLLKAFADSDGLPTHQLSITLLDSNAALMQEESLACRTALAKIMKKYNIEVKQNVFVERVDSTHVYVISEGGAIGKIPYTHCIWATGAQGERGYMFKAYSNTPVLTIPIYLKLMNCRGSLTNNAVFLYLKIEAGYW